MKTLWTVCVMTISTCSPVFAILQKRNTTKTIHKLRKNEQIINITNIAPFVKDSKDDSKTTSSEQVASTPQKHNKIDTIPKPSISFEGISQAELYLSGQAIGTPPDTNGAVGPGHYVQAVNKNFAIYNKEGEVVMPPKSFSELFAGEENCTTHLNGPIVLYDHFVQRWIFSIINAACNDDSSTDPSCFICLAVSKSADPTGEFYLYSARAQEDPDNSTKTILPDYPKLGVWSDAYVLTTRDIGINYEGVSIYVFEKSRIIEGKIPRASKVRLNRQDYNESIGTYLSLLPSDVDGSIPPPKKRASPLLSYQAKGNKGVLYVWDLMINWDDLLKPVAISSNPTSLSVESFKHLCAEGIELPKLSCVPQPGTNYGLESLTQFLMHRLAYRNFGKYESLVVTHSIEGKNGTASIRWYEIRRYRGKNYHVFQQGTYDPNDGINRWLGSIAQDSSGNIAVGYSVSNGDSVYPGIRYTGRLAQDPINSMTLGEAVLAHGSGSQIHSGSRWGEYSSMSIDPVDDCTFWYTNEYYTATGQLLGENKTDGQYWNTRIGNFKLPGCGHDRYSPSSLADAQDDLIEGSEIYQDDLIEGEWYQDDLIEGSEWYQDDLFLESDSSLDDFF